MTIPVSVQLERDNALYDVQWEVDLYGEDIILRLRGESTIDRDNYNSIKQRDNITGVTVKVYPVTMNPNQHQIEKCGLRENVDAMAYLPMKTLTDNSYGFEDIDLIRSSVIMRGIKWWIKDKTLFSQFADTYLYVILGLRRA